MRLARAWEGRPIASRAFGVLCVGIALLSGIDEALGQPLAYRFGWTADVVAPSGSAPPAASAPVTFTDTAFEVSIPGMSADVFAAGQNFVNAGAAGELGPGLAATVRIGGGAGVPLASPVFVFADHVGFGDGISFAQYVDSQLSTATTPIVTLGKARPSELQSYDLRSPLSVVDAADGLSASVASLITGSASYTFDSIRQGRFSAVQTAAGALVYDFSWLGSGTQAATGGSGGGGGGGGGGGSSEARFEVLVQGDAADVFAVGANFVNAGAFGENGPGLFATVSVDGAAPVPLAGPLFAFADHMGVGDGVSLAEYVDSSLSTASSPIVSLGVAKPSALEGYDLRSAFGPIFDATGGLSVATELRTADRTYVLSNVRELSFQAVAVVPEPDTSALVAGGLLLLALSRYRQDRARRPVGPLAY